MFATILSALSSLLKLIIWGIDQWEAYKQRKLGAAEAIKDIQDEQKKHGDKADEIHHRVDTDDEYRKRLRDLIDRRGNPDRPSE